MKPQDNRIISTILIWLQTPILTLIVLEIAIQKRIWDFEGLWIDQICINQRSTEEKTVAIPAMAALYKHARLVIVALSDIEVNQEEQRSLRHLIRNFEKSGENLTSAPFRRMKPPYMSTETVLKGFWEKLLGSRVCSASYQLLRVQEKPY